MKKYYQSLTMGNIVLSKRELIAQVFESLFRCHVLDVRWREIWL